MLWEDPPLEAMQSSPLKPQRFYILLALADRDRHGADIQREVRELSGGQVKLWPAMLYSTLEGLLEDGWITEIAGDQRPAGASERRRYYRIEPLGREAVRAEAERMARLVEIERLRNPRTEEAAP